MVLAVYGEYTTTASVVVYPPYTPRDHGLYITYAYNDVYYVQLSYVL